MKFIYVSRINGSDFSVQIEEVDVPFVTSLLTAYDYFLNQDDSSDTQTPQTQLLFWWVPNLAATFRLPVASVQEGWLAHEVIAQYDLFLGDRYVRTNAGGLEEWDESENTFMEWNSELGDDITEFKTLEELEKALATKAV